MSGLKQDLRNAISIDSNQAESLKRFTEVQVLFKNVLSYAKIAITDNMLSDKGNREIRKGNEETAVED